MTTINEFDQQKQAIMDFMFCNNPRVIANPAHDEFGCIEHLDYGDEK